MLTLKPGLRQLLRDGTRRNVVSFVYDFSTDTPGPVNAGGASFLGSQYNFDITSLNLPAGQGLNDFRSMQLSCSFLTGDSGQPDGDLFITSQTTQQVIRFSPAPITLDSYYSVISGIVPVASCTPDAFSFTKAVSAAGTMSGILNVSFFDFDTSSYVTQGVSLVP